MIADVVIRRILGRAARVTDSRANHSGDGAELGVRAPESPQCKCGGLDFFMLWRVAGCRFVGISGCYGRACFACVDSSAERDEYENAGCQTETHVKLLPCL